jgi:hypothetical protein
MYQFVCVGFILTSYDLIHLQPRNKCSPTATQGERNGGKKVNNGMEFLRRVEKELNPPWNKSVLAENFRGAKKQSELEKKTNFRIFESVFFFFEGILLNLLLHISEFVLNFLKTCVK